MRRLTLLISMGLIPVMNSEELVENAAIEVHQPKAECNFTVHNGGPKGPVVEGTTLNTELYYRIQCKPVVNYCLRVSNCTVSGEDKQNEKPYPIIDASGCTLEPSLFEHVQFEDDFTAGIYNPLPIRFRGSSSAVRLHCSTTLSPRLEDTCTPRLCTTWNEYSRKYNNNDGQ